MRKPSDFRSNISVKGPILFIDMDGVVCDFDGRIEAMIKSGIPESTAIASKGLFAGLDPMPGAIETIHDLEEKYEIYFLTTAPWSNVLALNWPGPFRVSKPRSPAYAAMPVAPAS
jgi:hypothetical protein